MAQQLKALTALAGDRRSGDPMPLAPALLSYLPPHRHTCMPRMSDPTFYGETPHFLCKDGSVRIGEDVVGQQAELSVAHISLSLHLPCELGRGLSPATCILFSHTEAFSSLLRGESGTLGTSLNAGLAIMTIESGYCLAVQTPSLPGRFLLYSCPKLESESENCTPKLSLYQCLAKAG